MVDLLPYRLDTSFRPGVAYTLRFDGPTAWLTSYTFTATLGGTALAVTEDGDDLVVVISAVITAAKDEPEWSTFLLTESTAGVVLTGKWEPSLNGTLSPDSTIPIVLGATEIAVTLTLGPAGIGGSGTIRVEDEGGSVVATAVALNFAGAGVTTTDAGGGEALVTIPGGGGGGSPTGAAGGVLGGTYPNPSFAADMATQAELDIEAASRLVGDRLVRDPAHPTLVSTPRTLALTDHRKILAFDVATLTVPPHSSVDFPVGFTVEVYGEWSLTAGLGVTIVHAEGTHPAVPIDSAGHSFSLRLVCLASNQWRAVVFESLSAPVKDLVVTNTATFEDADDGILLASPTAGLKRIRATDDDTLTITDTSVERLAKETFVTSAVAAEAALARNADNLTGGTVADARVASTIARDSEVTSAVAAEAVLARNADNLTSGTVADARIAASITRDSEAAAAYAPIAEPIAAAHIADTSDAHDASAISISDAAGDFTATDVEGALAELQTADEALPLAAATTDVIPDAISTPGSMLWKLGTEIGKYDDLTLRLSSQVRMSAARCTTVVALPACTYANGSSGVGATLTGNANGAIPVATADQVTLAVGNWVLVKAQASGLQNGLYEVTAAGSAGAVFVLTRVPCADEAADYLAGVVVLVGEGVANRGRAYVAQDTIVMGTTAITWRQRGAATVAQARMGQSPQQLSYFSDFTELDIALAPNAAHQRIPGTEFTVNIPAAATAGAAIQASAAGSPGIIQMGTGSTATGYVGVYAGLVAFTFATASECRYGARVIIPTLSTSGVQEFICRAGFIDDLSGVAPANGMYFEARGDASNWRAVCRVGGVETGSTIDTAQAQGVTAKTLAIWYDPLTLTAHFYMSSAAGMVEVATIVNTNLPTGASLLSAAAIDKIAGTTARTFQVDNMASVIPDTRANQYLLP